MRPAEVLDMIARLEVAYRTELTDPERRLWVEELEGVDAAIALAAAEDRIRSSSPFMPKVGEVLALVREAYAEAPTITRPALEAGEVRDELAQWPEEVAERVHAMIESSDPEHARLDEEVSWHRDRARLAALPRLKGVCTGAGKAPVMVEGVLSCPDCRSPIADGCRPGISA